MFVYINDATLIKFLSTDSTLILSCKYRCGSEANPLSTNNGCSCASTCYNSNNCCADFKKYCKSEDSAASKTRVHLKNTKNTQ